uniref:Small ribosomal subunit protein uS4c n=1 Tax=Caulerpa cliftonii TaxID=1004391 RepID=A0A1C9JBU4_9CHLO|nr:ribosomal protein S4 [Caulerpa cliftonii]AOP19317.1 ribosomal protein S4 [Caulerpa cliftonii]
MSRYRGPKLRILKRLGSLPGFGLVLNQKLVKLSSKKEGAKPKKERAKPKKESAYTTRLKEKQKLRYHYGLTEKSLINYVRKARRKKTSKWSLSDIAPPQGHILLELLEMRLDNIIFRYGYAPTLPAARQRITHGHILLNDKVINRPSYQCEVNDIINIKKPLKQKKRVWPAGSNGISPIKIQQKISREDVGLYINELLVIEYYSRSL